MASRMNGARRVPLPSIPEIGRPLLPRLKRRNSVSKGLNVALGPKTKVQTRLALAIPLLIFDFCSELRKFLKSWLYFLVSLKLGL
jgi:hypothetical protein